MAAWAEMMMPLRLDRARVPEAKYRWFERVQREASADAVLDLADLLIGTDLTGELGLIRTPTLLLAPAQSPFVPLPVMEEMHARIPGSELQVFTDARHGPALFTRSGLRRRAPGVPGASFTGAINCEFL